MSTQLPKLRPTMREPHWNQQIHLPSWEETCRHRFSSVQFSSVTQSCLTLCDPMNCSTPGLPVHHQLPEFTQTYVHWVGDAIQPAILCRPLLLLPPAPPSIRVFSNESTLCMRWPRYWQGPGKTRSAKPHLNHQTVKSWSKCIFFSIN